MNDLLCGEGADARYCPVFWDQRAELARLREIIEELLGCTGLDDDEKQEYLQRAGIDLEEDDE